MVEVLVTTRTVEKFLEFLNNITVNPSYFIHWVFLPRFVCHLGQKNMCDFNLKKRFREHKKVFTRGM